MTQVEPAEQPRSRVLDGEGITRAVRRLAHEVLERHGGDIERIVVAGIRQGGLLVADSLAGELSRLLRRPVAQAAVDIGGFRDDRPRNGRLRAAWQRQTEPVPRYPYDGPPAVDGAIVLLVDDVIQTGRTMRAAFDAVASEGRPAAIEIAVLVDRGGREVPVKPTYVGKNLPVSPLDWVDIVLGPPPRESAVYLVKRA